MSFSTIKMQFWQLCWKKAIFLEISFKVQSQLDKNLAFRQNCFRQIVPLDTQKANLTTLSKTFAKGPTLLHSDSQSS